MFAYEITFTNGCTFDVTKVCMFVYEITFTNGCTFDVTKVCMLFMKVLLKHVCKVVSHSPQCASPENNDSADESLGVYRRITSGP